jgi:WD40 repeat protein/serine/threonine protein kinase
MSDESIFAAALGKAPGAERRAFLEGACGGDESLRRRIERLLEADGQTAGILERGPDAGGTDDVEANEPALLPERVFAGRFKLRQKLGEGGMGEVWVADQAEPVQRRVAIKVVRPGLDSERMLARFEQERQALALMDHPNIAKVLDAGMTGEVARGGWRVAGKEENEAFSPSTRHAPPATPQGRPYFVMELIKGVPITEYCDGARLSPRERLALFVPVCEAVQHAHQKGVVHRDLKPSNIIVALYDGRPVPKVIDFGIAKATGPRLTDRSIYTEVGALVGTLEYMAPEQAELNNLDIDTRADVYALGAILYELLTGSVPFSRQELQSSGFLEMLRVIREVEPARPSTKLSKSGTLPSVADVRRIEPQKLVSLMRGELDWIILKCLEKDRGRRYQAASGLARDLEHYLADEPVEACPPTAGYRLRKFARKYRRPMGVAGAFLLLLVTGVVASTWQAIRATAAEKKARSSERAALSSEQAAQERKEEADEARQLAEQRRDEVVAVNDTLRRANYVADMNLARVAWDESNLGRTRELLEKHRPRPGETDLRGFEWHYLRRLSRRDLLNVKAHAGGVNAVAFTPDGKRLVTSGSIEPRRKMFDPRPGEVKFWDAATGQPLQVHLSGRADNLERAVLSPDGTHLAATQLSPTILVWDLATGGLVTLEGPPTLVAHELSFSPDSKRLACAYSGDDGDAARETPRSTRIWDLVTRRAVVTIDGQNEGMSAAAFSPDGRLLAFNDWRMARVKVCDAATGHEAFTCQYNRGQLVLAAAFSRDGKRLAGCGTQGIRIWDLASRETPVTWPADSGSGSCLAFSPDGKRLAMGGVEGLVELWDSATSQKVQTFKGHVGPVNALAFSPDGARLATGGADGTLRILDTAARRDAVSIPQDGSSLLEIPALSPDGLTLLTDYAQGKGRRPRLWDTSTGEPRCGPIELPQAVDSGAASTAEGKRSFLAVGRAAWTADGKRLYLADTGKTIRVVDVTSGKVIRTFAVDVETDGHISFTYFMAICPDEKWCAHACPDGAIQVRDAQTGARIRTLRGLDGVLGALVFSPDGSRLLGADEHGTVKIWDVATGREIAATKLTGVLIMCARFSPDGKRLAVGGLHGQLLTGDVRILDAETAREVWSLRGHTLLALDVVFSPDGFRLATTSGDHTVRLWDLTTGQEILKLVDSGTVDRVRFVADGRRIIGATRDRRVRVWDATPMPE